MHVILFIFMVFLLIVVVRVGAVLFHLTGMEWNASWFQAVSCITSTGFTTRESEMITATPERRRIAALLMILGSAGLVTLIAAIANSLRTVESSLQIPMVDVVVPAGWQPLVNLAIMILSLLAMWRLFTRTWLASGLTNWLQLLAKKRAWFRLAAYHELLIVGPNAGVAEILMPPELAEHPVEELGFAGKNIQLLAICRDQQTLLRPAPSALLKPLDRLICFGDFAALHDIGKGRNRDVA